MRHVLSLSILFMIFSNTFSIEFDHFLKRKISREGVEEVRANVHSEEYLFNRLGIWWEVNETNYEWSSMYVFNRDDNRGIVEHKSFYLEGKQYFKDLTIEARELLNYYEVNETSKEIKTYLNEEMVGVVKKGCIVIGIVVILQFLVTIGLLYLNVFYAKLAATAMIRASTRKRDYSIMRRYHTEMSLSRFFVFLAEDNVPQDDVQDQKTVEGMEGGKTQG